MRKSDGCATLIVIIGIIAIPITCVYLLVVEGVQGRLGVVVGPVVLILLGFVASYFMFDATAMKTEGGGRTLTWLFFAALVVGSGIYVASAVDRHNDWCEANFGNRQCKE